MTRFRAIRSLLLCALLVLTAAPIFASAPTVAWTFPTSHTGTGTTFSVSVVTTDPAGASDISWSWFAFGSGGPGACGLVYYRAWNQVYIVSDDASIQYGGYAPGANATLGNSQCTIDMSRTIVSAVTNGFAISYTGTFSNSFTGNRGVYGLASDNAGNGNGWWQLGTWMVGMNSINGASGAFQSFNQSDTTVDDYSGAIVPVPTSQNPLPHIALVSTASGNHVVKVNESFTFRLSNLRPNVQVRAIEVAATAHVDGALWDGTQVNDFFVGTSDASGQVIWQNTMSNYLEAHTYAFYYWCNGQCSATPLEDRIGNGYLWATDASGTPAPLQIFIDHTVEY